MRGWMGWAMASARAHRLLHDEEPQTKREGQGLRVWRGCMEGNANSLSTIHVDGFIFLFCCSHFSFPSPFAPFLFDVMV